jgi:hypothetical protein
VVRFSFAELRGVGQQEEALPAMGCPDLGRAEHVPFTTEPETGQRPENLSEGISSIGSKEPSHVLQEDVPRSHLANDPGDVWPEPALIPGSSSGSGGTDRLAWETGRDEIHSAAPRSAIEGLEIVPDRSPIQGLVFHPRHEQGRCVGFPLDVTHNSVAVSEGELESKLQPSGSGAQSQAIHTGSFMIAAIFASVAGSST